MAEATAATKLTDDQKAWLDRTKKILSLQRLWECYASLGENFEYVSDFRGTAVKLFSTALSDRGTLNAVLSHLIKNEAWGPAGPKTLLQLYGQAITSNKHDQGRKGPASISEMRIGLKLKGNSLALRPLLTDTSKVWVVETEHKMYSYTKNVLDQQFAEMAANTVKLFKLTKLLIETVLVLGGEIEELDDDKLRYILVSQSPCEPVSGFSYSDSQQPASEYVAKAARDAITDDNDGVPNLCGKKGLTTDIATVYKCMFRLGKSPTKLAIIVIGGGKRHPVSLAQLGELLNSIMEDARQEVIDQMMQEGKKAKVPSVPDVNSSFDLDQECLLVIGVASNLPVGRPARQLNYTASDQLEYITWAELHAIGRVAGQHNTE